MTEGIRVKSWLVESSPKPERAVIMENTVLYFFKLGTVCFPPRIAEEKDGLYKEQAKLTKPRSKSPWHIFWSLGWSISPL